MAKKPTGERTGRVRATKVAGPAKVAAPAKRRVRKAAEVDGQLERETGAPTEGVAKGRKPRAKPVPKVQVTEKPKRVSRRRVTVPAPVDPVPEPVAQSIPVPDSTPVARVETPVPAHHDEELPHGLSPVDLPLPAEGEQPGLGWMTRVLLLSSLLLLLFNSFAIDKWARALPVNAYSGQIIDAADQWHGLMDRIDFNLPLETGRSAWHWVKDLKWPGTAEQDGPTDAASAA